MSSPEGQLAGKEPLLTKYLTSSVSLIPEERLKDALTDTDGLIDGKPD